MADTFPEITEAPKPEAKPKATRKAATAQPKFIEAEVHTGSRFVKVRFHPKDLRVCTFMHPYEEVEVTGLYVLATGYVIDATPEQVQMIMDYNF